MGSVKPLVRPRTSTVVSTHASSRPISRLPATGVSTGFVLADMDFQLLSANRTGLEILSYPRELRGAALIALVQNRMRSIFTVERFTDHLHATRFVSGRRRYVCRPFLVESSDRPAMAALVLERHDRDQLTLADAGQRFRLSRREWETV